MNRSSSRCRAFTLIELLVVIAIIMLLAAILFPVFARARDKGRRAAYQSNVKQILLGLTQYSQDYDERMVHAYSKFAPKSFNTWQQFLQPYLKSTQIFTCPNDSKTGLCSWQVTPAPQGAVNPFHSSYVGNIMAMGNDEFGTSISLASVVSPTTTVFIAFLKEDASWQRCLKTRRDMTCHVRAHHFRKLMLQPL